MSPRLVAALMARLDRLRRYHAEMEERFSKLYWADDEHSDGRDGVDLSVLLDAGADLQHVTLMNMSPLAYCCSLCDEELAVRVVHEGQNVDINEPGTTAGAFTALHYAAEFSMCHLAAALIDAGSDLEARTEDMLVPSGGAVPGGRTALHLAAAKGDTAMMKLLLTAGADVTAMDYDGNSPLFLATVEGRGTAVAMLQAQQGASDMQLHAPAELRARKELGMRQAKQRLQNQMSPGPELRAVHLLRRVWTKRECKLVLRVVNRVAQRKGWHTNRHAAYATTDMRCSDLPLQAAVWVRRTISRRLFPEMCSRYGLGCHRLSFRDLFFVYYRAVGGQSELLVHRDGSILSFNILLNDRADFEGGGTFFQDTGAVHCVEQAGDALLHSGQVLHGGAAITAGERYLLVGFVNAVRVRTTSGARALISR